jgi:hypothetical protein
MVYLNNVLGESNHNGCRRWCLSRMKSRRLLVDCHHVNSLASLPPFSALLYPFSSTFHPFSSFLSSSLFCAHAHVTGYWKWRWEKSTLLYVRLSFYLLQYLPTLTYLLSIRPWTLCTCCPSISLRILVVSYVNTLLQKQSSTCAIYYKVVQPPSIHACISLHY